MEILSKFLSFLSEKISSSIIYRICPLFICFIIRKFCNRPRTWLTASVEGKIIIFTGASDGIGKEAALQLVRDGAKVVFACRNKEKTESAIKELKNEKWEKNAFFIELDLSSFESVKKFVKTFKQNFQRLDILVNNAALVNQNYQLTQDGIEATLQTNTFSPMILTQLLRDYIQNSKGKVINVTGKIFYIFKREKEYFDNLKIGEYDFEKNNYSGIYQYSYSKLGNVFFTKYLNKKGINSTTLHPGVINTSLTRDMKGIFWFFFKIIRYPLFMLFSKSKYMGAQTILHLCYAENEEFQSGEYYEDNKITKLKDWVLNEDNLASFMEFSKKIIDFYGKGKDIRFTL